MAEDMGDALPADGRRLDDAPRAVAAPRCISLRPALTHRLYSHRLHVRAFAKLQRDRLLSGPMIDIYVGEARRHWSLHRNLLCHHSELLEAELDGDSDDDDAAAKDTLELPDHDPAGFELLVKWLYQGKLDDVSDMPDANQKYDYAVRCHKLYLLCDRFDMPQLKNVAMDQYRKGLNEAELVPDAEEIDDIYRKSPARSPFRQLMARIAARQIMDPASHRDIETYRPCFAHNPDFAIDLFTAIRHSSGGILFEDPTRTGHECEYHDHEAGPNCHIKGKVKGKQDQLGQPSANTAPAQPTPDTKPVLLRPPRLPRPPKTPRQPPPPPPALPPGSLNVGPLRRSITSPAISTVETSTETVIAIQPPSPEMARDREKGRERLRRVTPPDSRRRQLLSRSQTTQGIVMRPSPLAPVESLRSSVDESRLSAAVLSGEVEDDMIQAVERTPSRRGLWDWARAGTGKFSMIGRISEHGSSPFSGEDEGAMGEFSTPSTTARVTPNHERNLGSLAAKFENMSMVDPTLNSPYSFARTRPSSDELVDASSSVGTPEPRTLQSGYWHSGESALPVMPTSPPSITEPETPTPQPRRKATPVGFEDEHTPTQEVPGHAKSDSESTLHENTSQVNTPQEITPQATPRKQSVVSKSPPPDVTTFKTALTPNFMSSARGRIASP